MNSSDRAVGRTPKLLRQAPDSEKLSGRQRSQFTVEQSLAQRGNMRRLQCAESEQWQSGGAGETVSLNSRFADLPHFSHKPDFDSSHSRDVCASKLRGCCSSALKQNSLLISALLPSTSAAPFLAFRAFSPPVAPRDEMSIGSTAQQLDPIFEASASLCLHSIQLLCDLASLAPELRELRGPKSHCAPEHRRSGE